jgi:hypothetical protein
MSSSFPKARQYCRVYSSSLRSPVIGLLQIRNRCRMKINATRHVQSALCRRAWNAKRLNAGKVFRRDSDLFDVVRILSPRIVRLFYACRPAPPAHCFEGNSSPHPATIVSAAAESASQSTHAWTKSAICSKGSRNNPVKSRICELGTALAIASLSEKFYAKGSRMKNKTAKVSAQSLATHVREIDQPGLACITMTSSLRPP